MERLTLLAARVHRIKTCIHGAPNLFIGVCKMTTSATSC